MFVQSHRALIASPLVIRHSPQFRKKQLIFIATDRNQSKTGLRFYRLVVPLPERKWESWHRPSKLLKQSSVHNSSLQQLVLRPTLGQVGPIVLRWRCRRCCAKAKIISTMQPNVTNPHEPKSSSSSSSDKKSSQIKLRAGKAKKSKLEVS